MKSRYNNNDRTENYSSNEVLNEALKVVQPFTTEVVPFV